MKVRVLSEKDASPSRIDGYVGIFKDIGKWTMVDLLSKHHHINSIKESLCKSSSAVTSAISLADSWTCRVIKSAGSCSFLSSGVKGCLPSRYYHAEPPHLV